MNDKNIYNYEKKNDSVDESNHRVIRFVIIILIIIIIILLLLHACYKDTDEGTKTGGEGDKTDIIDDGDSKDKTDDGTTDDGSGTGTSTDNSSTSTKTISISILGEEGVDVNTKLDIFSNFTSTTSVDGTVAPTDSDIYTFSISNTGDIDVVYSFYFEDSNPYEIDMRYRLTDASGNYIAGSDTTWVSASDIAKSNISLASGNKNVYYLEWKWFESGNDTNAAGTSDYVLMLNVDAEG